MSDVLMVPVTTVQPDLVTQTDVVVYVPLASRTAPGIVKIGNGLTITDSGLLSLDRTAIDNIVTPVVGQLNDVNNDLQAHKTDYANPHNVTKGQVGLSNVDNTSDLEKPISTAVRTEFLRLGDDINRLEALIEGQSSAISFENYEAVIATFNYAATNQFPVGQIILVNTTDIPDLWVYSVENTHVDYAYVGDYDVVEQLKEHGTIQFGYYKLAQLESKEINLANYVSLDGMQTITGVKLFNEQLGIVNPENGDVNLLKHINNNFLLSANNGENILNIDEQSKKLYFYNQPVALESYSDENFISYTTVQNLTDAQKEMARNNIGAGTGDGGSQEIDSEMLEYYEDIYYKVRPNLLRFIPGDIIIEQQGDIGETPQKPSDGELAKNIIKLQSTNVENPGVKLYGGANKFEYVEGKEVNYSAKIYGLKKNTKYTLSFVTFLTWVESVLFGERLLENETETLHKIEFTTNSYGQYTFDEGLIMQTPPEDSLWLGTLQVIDLSLVEGDYVGYTFPRGDVVTTYDVQSSKYEALNKISETEEVLRAYIDTSIKTTLSTEV